MKPNELVIILIEAADQIRAFHWGTKSFAEHTALGDLYGAVSVATDKVAEASMGCDGNRLDVSGALEIKSYSEGAPAKYLAALCKELCAAVEDGKSEDLGEDVVNILQDLIADVNKTRYLLTLS